MTTRIYGFTALTGGGTGALDKYPEAGMPALATDDYAIGHVAGVFYIYWFNGASAEAESPPAIIAPASGSGRWILKGFSFAHNDLASIDGGNASPEEYYHLSSADYNTINTALAQSILANPTGGAAPITNLTVAEQTLVGRITGGNVDDLSVTQVKTLIGDVSDTAYAASWDGVTDVAPSKNAVYDELYTRSRRNAIINGNMSVWQRGTTTLTNPANGTYFPDRFSVGHVLGDGTYKAICESITPAAGFPFTSALKIDCTQVETAVAAGEYMFIHHKVEGYDFVPFEGRTATLSFWVKATKVGTYCVVFRNNAYDKSYIAEYTVNTTNTWEKKSVTLTFNSGGTFLYTNGIGVGISWVVLCGSTYQTTKDVWANGNYLATSNQVNGFDSTDNNFSLTGIQLELGSTATEFECRPFAEELALCQRYYETKIVRFGLAWHTHMHQHAEAFAVTKRIDPTCYVYPAVTMSGTVGNVYDVTYKTKIAATISVSINGFSLDFMTPDANARNLCAFVIAYAEL